MPTAVEYALVTGWHAQNGCGSGPPALNVVHTQNGGGSGPPHLASEQSQAVTQPVPAGELLLTSPLAVLLLAVTVLTTLRRRRRKTLTVSG